MALKDSLNKFVVESSILCPFARLYHKLSPEDKKVLQEAMDKDYPNVTIARALRAEGHRIAEITVTEHRKGICRCPKNTPPLKKS